MFGDASYGQVSLFFSLIGLLNALLFWPIVLLLHFTGAEVIVWDRVPWIPLVVAGALSLGKYTIFTNVKRKVAKRHQLRAAI